MAGRSQPTAVGTLTSDDSSTFTGLLTESFRAISAALSRQSPDTGRAPCSFILRASTSPPSVRMDSSMTPASQTSVSQGRRRAARSVGDSFQAGWRESADGVTGFSYKRPPGAGSITNSPGAPATSDASAICALDVELKNFHTVADGSRSISAMAQHEATYRTFELLPRSKIGRAS